MTQNAIFFNNFDIGCSFELENRFQKYDPAMKGTFLGHPLYIFRWIHLENNYQIKKSM